MTEAGGLLVVDKPGGLTSHDVVARVRRLVGVARVGHTGTLDPFATGVLALLLGRATRLARFLSGREKEYEAEIGLGLVTDTYDRTGRFSRPAAGTGDGTAPPVGRADVERVLDAFRGTFLQTPPPYSAKKVAGIRAYALARRSEAPALAPVRVSVEALSLREFQPGAGAPGEPEQAPRLRLHLVCSAGFYVRALAHDIGQRLGCGAWLHELRRTRSGDFTLAEATPLEELERRGRDALALAVPPGNLLRSVPAVVLNERGVRRASHGNDLAPEHFGGPAPAAPLVRLLEAGGELAGLAVPRDDGLLHPVVVLM